ncbi:flagellar basal body L-ring protein FlgH [Hyphomicrobium sp.]|jgi:flagellar L-ring protein precursor FlgH|uniref:flagellar basal body L-ring protein FlgH n=1 Tax=Hyphomicrobium sp. TaxID=82 RepID=UPI002BCD1F46|nr:flagellar basal body L-ring protein FlgH [Hyphomicrobium sp.]HVZ04384.1 flagellar basal body L-ring protein FlgH [Hyphomicrobium sp.]
MTSRGKLRLAPIIAASMALLLQACALDQIKEIGREPTLSPVGSGLVADRVPHVQLPITQAAYRSGNSTWQDSGADLFRDARAFKAGDVVTVNIQIKDQASLDNTLNRSRDSSVGLQSNLDFDFGFGAPGPAGSGKLNGNLDRTTATDSKGGITRSENINLLVAAVVTQVLPNGNLVISGTQEVRVNYEVRVLSVAGVIRPRDISTDNQISYDKIAEARVSYGGRGRVMEVQQPAYGQQILDMVSPF